jgi:hypothetical protein
MQLNSREARLDPSRADCIFAAASQRTRVPRLALLVAALQLSFGAGADDAVARHPCAQIVADSERLHCYDAHFPPNGQHAPVPARAEVAPESPEAFGLSEAQRRAAAGAPAQEASIESIASRAKELRRRPTGEMIILLENGQTWVQIDSGASQTLRAGDEVTIKRAAMGSFLLTSPGHGIVRVRRLN